jgi:xylanolytic transcriptional activator XlnR
LATSPLFAPRTANYAAPAHPGPGSCDTAQPSITDALEQTTGQTPIVLSRTIQHEHDRVRPSQARSAKPYKCLDSVLPLLTGIVSPSEACELLEFYFAQPGSSLFRSASPYVLTHVLRKKDLLHSTSPRSTSSALLCTILWVSAQTADLPLLLLPGERARVCEDLRKVCVRLIHRRDRDWWERLPGGQLVEAAWPHLVETETQLAMTREDQSAETVDDVLTFVLICIVVSGSDHKTDCQLWWNKAVRLMYKLGMNRVDLECGLDGTCLTSICKCRRGSEDDLLFDAFRAQEESRRVFWLLFALDRHLALSYNSTLCIGDDECHVYIPLSDDVWNSREQLAPTETTTARAYGPPTTVTGTGLFEWFLPLMTILGDVIHVHHRRLHPRFGAVDDNHEVALIEASLEKCAQSISDVQNRFDTEALNGAIPASEFLSPSSGYQDTPLSQPFDDIVSQRPRGRAQAQLVTAYGTFILHVLHVLLHGKWDAVSMLENDDGWITSVPFMKCASHAIAASEAVSLILGCDPELTFMPYLFGIYLLHGSFILLLFADRMPQLGPNESVEKACETIIRAHEVCVVTLSTEFQVSTLGHEYLCIHSIVLMHRQKRFRKVLRSTLYSVRSAGVTNTEESKARRRALSLYRWTKGARGLAL